MNDPTPEEPVAPTDALTFVPVRMIPQTEEGLASLFPCECSDPGCPVHKGSECCSNNATSEAFRIDMDDYSGTLMCDKCAEDALLSGVFRIET
jgi:hypothetical protein